jgi:hypothetical protein
LATIIKAKQVGLLWFTLKGSCPRLEVDLGKWQAGPVQVELLVEPAIYNRARAPKTLIYHNGASKRLGVIALHSPPLTIVLEWAKHTGAAANLVGNAPCEIATTTRSGPTHLAKGESRNRPLLVCVRLNNPLASPGLIIADAIPLYYRCAFRDALPRLQSKDLPTDYLCHNLDLVFLGALPLNAARTARWRWSATPLVMVSIGCECRDRGESLAGTIGTGQ